MRKSPTIKYKNCKICNVEFSTKSNNKVKCDIHKVIKVNKKAKLKKIVHCVECTKLVIKPQRKTCSKLCHSSLQRKISYEKWKNGESKIITGNVGIKGDYYNNQWYRSKWEIAFAKYLDSKNIIFEYEKHRIDLKDSVYVPDFYIPSFNMFIEIKGWAKPEFLAKMEKVDILHPNMNLLVIQRPPPYDWVF